MDSISKYESWRIEQEDNSAKFYQLPVTKEKLSISSLSEEESYMKNFKNDMKPKILNKYLQNETILQKNSLISYQYHEVKRESIWTKPRLSKLVARIPSLPAPDEQPQKTAVISKNKIIKDALDIPCYFHSPEGRLFSVQTVKNKKLEILTETETEVPERTSQTTNTVNI